MPAKIKARSKPSKQITKLSPVPAKLSSKAKGNGSARKPVPKPALSLSDSGSEEEGEGDESEDDEEEQDGIGIGIEEDDEDEDDESDGVDEEGMQRLMKALGEDGLDEVGSFQLQVLQAGDGSEEEGDQEGSESEAEEGEGVEGEEDEDEGEVSGSEEEEGSKELKGVKKNGSRPAQRERLEDEDEDSEVTLEDAESIDEDAVPQQKIVTNNKIALERIRDTIKLDPSLPWTETLTVTYPETITVDVNDDLNRELAFYKQALHGASTARTLASQHSLLFTRPPDYFAEMVKSDAHMERIRQNLLDETAQIKRSEAKRREREGKKYGKQIQIEKIRERERSKREMEERLKGLKRKHKDALPSSAQTDGDEAFDVAVEDAIADRPRPSKRSKTSSPSQLKQNQNHRKPGLSRKARDAKFGFGFGTGKGRREKQNTRASTEKFDYAVGKDNLRGKGKPKVVKSKRPGKSKRASMRSR